MYKKAGSHPLIQQFNSKYDELEALDREIKDLEREANKNRPRPIYKLTAATQGKSGGTWGDPPDTYRFHLVLQNKSVFDELMNVFGGLTNPPEKEIHSVGYRLLNGMLIHTGGGHLIFGGFRDDPPLCSAEEWELLTKSLKIPDSIKRSSEYYVFESGN